MLTQYTVGSYLLDRLKELGIRHIFGVPGDYGFPFLDRIEAIGISLGSAHVMSSTHPMLLMHMLVVVTSQPWRRLVAREI